MLRVALAQINTTVGDLQGNSARILSFAAQARDQQADLVVFPELAVTGYPPEDLLFKGAFIDDNLKALAGLVGSLQGLAAVVGFVDRDRRGYIYNAAAVIAGGRLRGVYHKQALPNYGVFDEKRYFAEGKKQLMFDVGGIPVGVSICEDIWIRDGVIRGQAKAGARIAVNLSSSPYDFGKIKQREDLLRAQARSARMYVCYANTVGGQDELVFDGGSLVIDPKGKIVASARQFAEDLMVVDIPVEKPRQKKSGKIINIPSGSGKSPKQPLEPHLSAHLSRTQRIYQALVLGTRDYLGKNGFKKAVIGVSGGIDSALVAAIAVAAVGKENVIGVSMPSEYTSAGTRADSQQLARNLGIRHFEVPIGNIYQSYLDALKGEFADTKPDVTEENLQARIRGNILMSLSNKFGWIVLTTGNKSEIAVGYCTLYGDMSGGFAVIKDVPKTLVYEIARYINQSSGEVIPESILERPPTAELRKDQKDEDSLPPYEVLDPILKSYVEEHQSLVSLAKKNKNAAMVKDIVRMVDQSEYKRRQAPPGIKITPRAFGKDWRLPITNKYKGF